MDEFIGREEDLAFLEEFYNYPTQRAVALVGRKHVGKTRLIEKFVKDKAHIHVQFLDTSVRANLDRLESCMGKEFGHEFHFEDSMDFFFELGDAIKGKRYVIVLDEYQFVSSADDKFSPLLQDFIDHYKGDSMLIITGSDICAMDREYIGYTLPLYGRIHRYLLGPLGIAECHRFHPRMPDDDQMCMYLTFGGTPMHYDYPESKRYGEFLNRYVLRENSPLNIEGKSMVRMEFPHGKEYESILDSMASGQNTVPEIVTATGLDRSTVNHHLDGMLRAGFIEEMNMMAGAKPRPARYRIVDRMLAFQFHVMRKCLKNDPSCRTYMEMKEILSTFHGRMFELQCADYVKEHYRVREIGMWYGKVPRSDKDGKAMKDASGKTLTDIADIDVVAYIKEGKNTVEMYGECKFTGDAVSIEDVWQLESRMKHAHVGANSRMVFFSRSGFDARVKEYARDHDMILVDLPDMLNNAL